MKCARQHHLLTFDRNQCAILRPGLRPRDALRVVQKKYVPVNRHIVSQAGAEKLNRYFAVRYRNLTCLVLPRQRIGNPTIWVVVMLAEAEEHVPKMRRQALGCNLGAVYEDELRGAVWVHASGNRYQPLSVGVSISTSTETAAAEKGIRPFDGTGPAVAIPSGSGYRPNYTGRAESGPSRPRRPTHC